MNTARMHDCSSRNVLAALAGCLVLTAVSVSGAQTNAPVAASTNAPTAPAPIVIPQSTFDPKVLKDPFFPESGVNTPKQPVKIDPANSQVAVKPRDAVDFLRLDAIMGSKLRPLVMINDVTFALHEVASVKTAGGEFRLKLVKIGVNSVLVTIDGRPDPKEIFLKDGGF